MGLTMAERKAVTKTMAKRCRAAGRTEKTTMLDELYALTGWTRITHDVPSGSRRAPAA